jgi:hypothetical protein
MFEVELAFSEICGMLAFWWLISFFVALAAGLSLVLHETCYILLELL